MGRAREKLMSVEEWVQVPDNPRQRDTNRRLGRAWYLARPTPLHSVVYAAELPDGSLVKLDGHTRAALWHLGKIPQPDFVRCIIVQVDTLEEAAKLYWTFDTPDCAKRLTDYLDGALRETNSVIKRPWLKKTIASGLSLIEQSYGSRIRRSLDKALAAWWKEIAWLDQYELPALFVRPPVTAALLLRAGNESTASFIANLPSGGSCQNGESDAIHALSRALEIMVAQGRTNGWSRWTDIAGKTLTAIDAWAQGRTFRTGIKGYDWSRMVAEHSRLRLE